MLLGLCDAKYKFTYFNVGAYGSESDGGIFNNSCFGRMLENGELDLPSAKPVYGSTFHVPYCFLGDAAFPLKQNLMVPFGGRNLDESQIFFNKEHSKGRVLIENTFGVLSSRWRILQKRMTLLPKNADHVVCACVVLHNFIIEEGSQNYINERYVDIFDGDNRINGQWRTENHSSILQPLPQEMRSRGASNSTRENINMRKNIKDLIFHYECSMIICSLILLLLIYVFLDFQCRIHHKPRSPLYSNCAMMTNLLKLFCITRSLITTPGTPQEKEFKRRILGTLVDNHPKIKYFDALGRVYTVHPTNFECYCLRLLLHKVRGPTSFPLLRTVNNNTYGTYREACETLGLLESDNHWQATMQDAVMTCSASRVRHLFAVLISTCGLSNPLSLWEDFKDDLAEDILHRNRLEIPDLIYNDVIYNEALLDIHYLVKSMCGKDLSSFGLPAPD